MHKATYSLFFLIFSLFLITSKSDAQNLVPNAGFEKNDFIPVHLSSNGDVFERAAKNWACPNQASTDLLGPRFDSNNLTLIPPKGGKNMAGLVVNGDYWAEYGRVKLKQPLIKGRSYYVEFWISMPTYYSKKKPVPTALNEYFGIEFGSYYFQYDKRIIQGKPEVAANSKIITEPEKWIKIHGTFVAEEEFDYLYIGQFQNAEGNSPIAEGYFLIDDIFVESFTSEAVDYEPSRYYRIEKGIASIQMDNIYFEHDKYDLLPESFGELNKLVNILNKNPKITIQIQGHTDDSGNDVYNKELSDARAKVVREYLTSQGINQERVSSQGYGLSKPIADNDTEEGREKNRRVEFVLEGADANQPQKTLQGPEAVYSFSDKLGSKQRVAKTLIGQYQWDCETGSAGKANDQRLINQLKNSTPFKAEEFIFEKAKTEKILIINERAEAPQHRAFTLSLLDGLYEQGYRYLALEGLSGEDTELTNRKYPVLNSGELIKEPVYGMMVREAIAKGFTVFSYQPTKEQKAKAGQVLKRTQPKMATADIINTNSLAWSQAMNINKILRSDPKAKVIVHCNDRASKEISFSNQKPMAWWINELARVNPFTIDQSVMSEKCGNEEDPYYSIRSVVQPTVFAKGDEVFVKKETNPNNELEKIKPYDIQVFLPKSKTINQRPSWLMERAGYTIYPFNPDKHGMSYPCIVMAYNAGEDLDFAVPADVIEIPKAGVPTALALKSGAYVFILRDKQKQKRLDIDVK